MQIAVESKFRHGDLVNALKKQNWTSNQAAEFLEISPMAFSDMINLKHVPNKYKPENVSVELDLRLWELTGKWAEELFPQNFFTPEFVSLDKVATVFIDVDRINLGHYQCFQLVESQENRIMRIELTKILADLILALEAEQKNVIYLYFWEDQNFKEIAGQLRISADQVRTIFSKAMKKLSHPSRIKKLKSFCEPKFA